MPSAITEWADRVAVIVGAATGVGRASAFALAERGAHIVLADRDEARLERTRSKLADTFHKRRIISLVVDVTEDADVEMLAAETLERFGHADFLLNSAALAVDGPWEHVPAADWQRSVDVNLLGVTRLLHGFLPALMRQRSGWIVNTVSSDALLADSPTAGPAAATAGAVVGLSKSLAIYLGGYGVGVSVLSPDPNETNETNEANETAARELLAGLAAGTFLISSPRTKQRLLAWAGDPDTEIARLIAAAHPADRSNP